MMNFNSRNPLFEVKTSVITGDSADVYLHRTQRIMRNEGMNPNVLMEFAATEHAIMCGALEVKAILSKVTSEGNREIWALEEGLSVSPSEVCLQVRAPYSSFGLYETAICGTLAHQTGWATAARRLTDAAKGIPVISVGAHNVHPSVAAVMDYAAVVGGCASGSTALGAKLANTPPVATVSGALVQLMGDPLKAVLAFDKAFPPDVQRVAYVDPRKDIIDQVISVAAGTKDHLNSVRISRAPGGRLVDASDIHLVRQRLDEIDANHVQIVLSGRLSPERIMDLVENNAPVDILHDTSYIASSSPVPFSPNIRSISDKEVPQELDPMPPNPRLLRLL